MQISILSPATIAFKLANSGLQPLDPLLSTELPPNDFEKSLINAIHSIDATFHVYKMSLPNHPLIDANAITPETITQQLVNDHKVKVAGIDGDGVLRGKIMSQEKFLASLKGGFGMSSAIFAWDMHDVLYAEEGAISSEKDGYGDFIAEVDLSSFRRLPFEDNIPFFMLKFKLNGVPVFADGRSLIQSTTEDMAKSGMRGLAGGMIGLCSISLFEADFTIQSNWSLQTSKRRLKMDMDHQQGAQISLGFSTPTRPAHCGHSLEACLAIVYHAP